MLYENNLLISKHKNYIKLTFFDKFCIKTGYRFTNKHTICTHSKIDKIIVSEKR